MTKTKNKKLVDRELRAKMKQLGWSDAPDGFVENIRLVWGTQDRWVLVEGRWWWSTNEEDRNDKSWRLSSFGPP